VSFHASDHPTQRQTTQLQRRVLVTKNKKRQQLDKVNFHTRDLPRNQRVPHARTLSGSMHHAPVGPDMVILAVPWVPLVEMSPLMVPAHVSTVPHVGMATHTMLLGLSLLPLRSSTEHALHCLLFMQKASHAARALSQSDVLVGQVGAANTPRTPTLFCRQYSPMGERSIATWVPLVSSTVSVTPTSVADTPLTTLVAVHAVFPAELNVATALPLAMRVTCDSAGVGKSTIKY
jgi:hypothetical protein